MSRRIPGSERQLRRLIWRKTMYARSLPAKWAVNSRTYSPLASAFALSCGTQARVKSGDGAPSWTLMATCPAMATVRRCWRTGSERDCGSGIQLIEQRLRFLQIECIEAFGEPAVEREHQSRSMANLACILERPVSVGERGL